MAHQVPRQGRDAPPDRDGTRHQPRTSRTRPVAVRLPHPRRIPTRPFGRVGIRRGAVAARVGRLALYCCWRWAEGRASVGVAVAVLLGACGVSGCGTVAERRDDVRDTTAVFERALGEGAYDRVCAVLAPATVEELEQQAGSPCARAMSEESLPPGRTPLTALNSRLAHLRAARPGQRARSLIHCDQFATMAPLCEHQGDEMCVPNRAEPSTCRPSARRTAQHRPHHPRPQRCRRTKPVRRRPQPQPAPRRPPVDPHNVRAILLHDCPIHRPPLELDWPKIRTPSRVSRNLERGEAPVNRLKTPDAACHGSAAASQFGYHTVVPR